MPLNPLGKIPALVLDDGRVLYDSPVICEYLDAEFGGRRLLPAIGRRALATSLTRAALVDGILDAAILARNDRLRPAAQQSQDWISWQLGKMLARRSTRSEREAATSATSSTSGTSRVGCALGYLPLRIPEREDPARWPRLDAWYAQGVAAPSFANGPV